MGIFDSLFGNGSTTKSSLTINNDVLQVDKQTVDTLNQNINQVITNNMIKQAASCSGGAFSEQDVNMSDLQAAEDINLNVNQKAKVLLNFSCVNSSDIKDTVSSSMVNDMMASLKASSDQSAINKMAGASTAESSSGFGSILSAPANSDSNVTMNNTYKSLSEKTQNITNIVSNTITKTFSADDVKNCISQVSSKQNVKLTNLRAGQNITGVITQDNAIEAISSCLNQSGVANAVTTGVLNKLGVEVVNSTTQASKNDASGNSSAVAKSSGLDDLIKSMFSGFSGIFGALTSSPGLSVVSSIVCVIVIIIIGYVMFRSNTARQIVEESLDFEGEEDMMMIGGFVGDLLSTISYNY